MSFSSGTFTINSVGQPVVTGTVISSTTFNALTADLATGLSTCLLKDGTQTVTGNIPMSSFKFTGLAAGSAAGNSLRYEQLFTTSAVQMLGSMEWVKGADIASATTTNLTTATGNAVHVTGTTTITAVTLGTGMWRLVIFDGALTLTHHATNNNLPGAANITTAAGDRAYYWSDGTTVYCTDYVRATSALPVNFSMSPITATLGGNVSLNNTGTFFTGPTIAQGTVGTWFVSGSVSLTDTAGAADIYVQLTDGTTVIDSAVHSVLSASAKISVSLSGYIVSPAGNLRISAKDVSSTSGLIYNNQTGLAKDSTITAIRIA